MIGSITLDRLSCVTEPAGSARPYLWTVLLQVSDSTIESGALVATIGFVPSPGGAQLPIADGIRPGDSAPLPSEQAHHLAGQFGSAEKTRHLILVTVLWDRHDTPFDAVLAGYDAFLSTTRDAVAGHLPELSSTSPDVVAAAIEQVKAEAAAAVDAAVRAKLSWGFQLRVYLKLAKADGMIDAAFRDVDLHTPAPGPFDLNYGTAPGSAYRIDATLAVADDPCEAESLRVRSLRQTVANAEAALAKLLAHEGANNQAQIETLQEQILVFRGELTDAQRALEQCVAAATHGIPAGTADPA
jgi:hypothetical protein